LIICLVLWDYKWYNKATGRGFEPVEFRRDAGMLM
jgi:hypothetical protein